MSTMLDEVIAPEQVVLYALSAKQNGVAVAEPVDEMPLPVPTMARPGSAEKIRILELRAQLGQALFHPDDPTFFHDQRRRIPWTLPQLTLGTF